MIRPIGLWVFKTAYEQLKVFQDRFQDESLFMAINLSIEQLRDEDIANKINKILRDTGTNPANIQIRSPKALPLMKTPLSCNALKNLRSLGYRSPSMISVPVFPHLTG